MTPTTLLTAPSPSPPTPAHHQIQSPPQQAQFLRRRLPTLTSQPKPNPKPKTKPLSPGLAFNQKLNYLSSLNINPNKALNLNPTLRSTPLSHVAHILSCLSSLGLSQARVSAILDTYPMLLSSDPHLSIYPLVEFVLYDCGIPFPSLAHFLSKCPRLFVSNVDCHLRPTLHFLTSLGIPPSHPQTPVLLVSSVPNTLLRKIRFLQSVGFSQCEVKNLVVRLPSVLTYSVENNLRPKLEFFMEEMGGELDEIKRYPQFFACSLERKIRPRWEVVKERGVRMGLWEMLSVGEAEFFVKVLEAKVDMGERCGRGVGGGGGGERGVRVGERLQEEEHGRGRDRGPRQELPRRRRLLGLEDKFLGRDYMNFELLYEGCQDV